MRPKTEPWIKFYFTDWRAEPRLQLCNRAARSLWLDMLGIMHEANPYGFLLVEGISPSTKQLARLVGESEIRVRGWLEELNRAGVPSVTGQELPEDLHPLIPDNLPSGVIFSRRMVRDAARRERDRTNGRAGGNPALKGQPREADNPAVMPRSNARVTRPIKPRIQNPESRFPPNPPAAVVIPSRAIGWEDQIASKAIAMLGKRFCDYWLFPCRIVPLGGSEVALEAPSPLFMSRVANESQRLHDLFDKSVKFTVIERSQT